MAAPSTQFEQLRTALAPRYTLLRELGRGGMATVYLAQDARHDRRVAVKVLRPELALTLGSERFLREIQIAAHLAHPHILPLHDSGESAGFLYYVMPYVEGETLRDRLDRTRELAVDEAVRIAREICDALSYAHQRGVIHRDIKPENILFMGGHAVLADFGVAAAIGSAWGGRLTQSGVSVGTPVYMSPEQAAGELMIDARSDLYSLGCVLYEMLAGKPPFHGPTAQAIVARKLSERPPRITERRPHASRELDEAVARALASSPDDRFETAAAFHRALTGAESSGTPTGMLARLATRPRRLVLSVAALVVAVALVGSGWRIARSDADATASASLPKTLAVLPFDNLGPPENEYFPLGVADEITTRLGTIDDISVVPRRAAERYVRPGMTMREIGERLGVEFLLLGSVRWDGPGGEAGNVRIALELMRVRDERQLWATTYNRVIDDVFEVQTEIAGQIAQRLGIELSDDERRRLRVLPTSNHEAYALYLKGRYFWNKRTEDNVETASSYFRQATDLDPGFALAWVGIADTWISRGWYSQLAPVETFPKAKAAVLRALQFDSTLAEAYASLAHIHLEYDHDWEAAERAYRRAIALDPRYPIGHHWYGGFLSAMGRHEEAMLHAETARRLDPLSLIIQTWVGLRHYFAGGYDGAIAEYRAALELDREFAPAHWHLGWAYELKGDFASAVTSANAALASDSNNLAYMATLARAHALAGDASAARSLLAQLDRASRERHVSAYHVALVHLALRDRERGLIWLERAYEERSPWIGYLKVEPRLLSLHSEPRFVELLRRARLAP